MPNDTARGCAQARVAFLAGEGPDTIGKTEVCCEACSWSRTGSIKDNKWRLERHQQTKKHKVPASLSSQVVWPFTQRPSCTGGGYRTSATPGKKMTDRNPKIVQFAGQVKIVELGG